VPVVLVLLVRGTPPKMLLSVRNGALPGRGQASTASAVEGAKRDRSAALEDST